MDYLKLTADKLSIDDISALVVDDRCGAVSVFVGTTRNNFDGKKVLTLEYEAYEPMALKAMKSICDEIRSKWPAVHGIAMYHRLGSVPCREASVVIAISSPHRRDSLDAVAHCIDQLKSTVPIWKKEVYDTGAPAWKENAECEKPFKRKADTFDKNLIQINVSQEELDQRIQNFIQRKREQVNISNIQDFIPNRGENETEDTESCARVRTQFVKRSDSKGHLKIRKVHNEWGPQTVRSFTAPAPESKPDTTGLPAAIAERVLTIEKFLNATPVSKDIYKRLKEMEEKIAYLEAMSPEYALFWKNGSKESEKKQENLVDYTFSADDIARKIEMLEKQAGELGSVPCREASVVIAISSPHRRDSLDAVAHCIDQLKSTVPIWKKEVYDTGAPAWKENAECEKPFKRKADTFDKNLIQINVSQEELDQRIQNFIQRKREQVNISNIQDFIPNRGENETEDTESCARVRTQFVKRSDSKGHLKIRKVHNEWGPQTVRSFTAPAPESKPDTTGLPAAIAERVLTIEKFLNATPVSKDIYKRLKEMEEKIAYLEAMSPEYALFWKNGSKESGIKQENLVDYTFSADDIARKIEMLEKQAGE